jgi:hypothetical protein
MVFHGPSVGALPNTAGPVFIAPQVPTFLTFTLTVTDSKVLLVVLLLQYRYLLVNSIFLIKMIRTA